MWIASETMKSRTYKAATPLGNLYVTIARDDAGAIRRIMAQCSKAPVKEVWCGESRTIGQEPPHINILLDTICHLARKLIKTGIDEAAVARMLCGYDAGWPLGYSFPRGQGERVKSLPDVIGKAMQMDFVKQVNEKPKEVGDVAG